MNYVQLKHEKLDLSAVNDAVADESCGAISFFVGTTRDNFMDKKVVTLEYEAFEPMAIKVMTKICEEVRLKWPDIKHIAIVHRLGLVPVKEASVIIAISSPHRETSLLGVREAIDALKQSVPIWKKEKYEGNEADWKENKESKDKRPVKRPKLNFDACPIETAAVAKSLIQIAADDVEVSRRIHCFLEKKRDEIDLQNISCFTENQQNSSCARVNGTAFKQKDSNGHLRVYRVKNEVGPQIKPDYTSTLNKLMGNVLSRIKREPEESGNALSHGIEERLENIEKFLGNKSTPAPRNVYERLKIVENKILFLESISPEYYHFLGDKPPRDTVKKCSKVTYSIEDLDKYIRDFM